MSGLAGLTLRNPVLIAAGCGGAELDPFGALSLYGAVVTRSITLDPRLGGPAPRLAESPAGVVHSTGLPNPGIDRFLATELPDLLQRGARVIVSVVGANLGEYAELGRRLAAAPGVSAVEVNVSTPDALEHGLLDARETFHLSGAVGAVARELPPGVPAIAKLRSDAVRIVESARAAVEAGAQAVVVGNAVPAALPDGRAAGLSGASIAPIALRCLREVRVALPDLDVVACGGVVSTADARVALDLGAVAVQVGSALLHDPTTAARIAAELGEDA